MIEFVDVGKTFQSVSGPIVALRNVNLTIGDGEIFGIIGLSGAGKSTLVRCINFLEEPTEGRVIVDGEDLGQVGPKRLRQIRRNIGMIFQSFNLLEQRNVFDNVKFPLTLGRFDRKAADARVEELLTLVGLWDRRKSYPSQLSGGQKQRVAIARALATNPKYLLCDEATSALDPVATESVLSLLRHINETLGVTIVVITHEMHVIEKICTSVAVIADSEIKEVGKVADVFSDPKTRTAKELIMPDLVRYAGKKPGEIQFRLLFNGESSDMPLISALALETGVAVNIVYADTKNVDGKVFGRMVITLPAEKAENADKVTAFFDENHIKYVIETDDEDQSADDTTIAEVADDE